MVKVNLARIISEFILHYVSVSEPKKTSQAKVAKLLRSGLLILSVIMVMLLTIIRH